MYVNRYRPLLVGSAVLQTKREDGEVASRERERERVKIGRYQRVEYDVR